MWAALATDEQAKSGYEGKIQGAYVSSMAVTEPSDFVISAKGKEAEERVWVSICILFLTVQSRFLTVPTFLSYRTRYSKC